jgi:hypothetical protein
MKDQILEEEIFPDDFAPWEEEFEESPCENCEVFECEFCRL